MHFVSGDAERANSGEGGPLFAVGYEHARLASSVVAQSRADDAGFVQCLIGLDRLADAKAIARDFTCALSKPPPLLRILPQHLDRRSDGFRRTVLHEHAGFVVAKDF